MPGKDKESAEKIPSLKGAAAEKRVLEYVNEMNRPFGAGTRPLVLFSSVRHMRIHQSDQLTVKADIYANLKGAVAKTAVQKLLVTLAEKDAITQKAYGKVLIYVAKQADLDELSPEDIKSLEREEAEINTANNELTSSIKNFTQELNRLRSCPTDSELESSIEKAKETYESLMNQLRPLRSGQPLVTAEELSHLNAEWNKWRTQWDRRRKIFYSLRGLVTDAMLPEERQDLDEMLGIEYDTSEHRALELGLLCTQTANARS